MEVIPAIDLLDGQCVRLHQGDYDQVTRFNEDPLAQALAWLEQGAQRLHLVDLDGARTGEPVNDAVVKAITAALPIPVQLGGGVRSVERAEELLACGLERVILGTVAVEQPELVRELARRFPRRIAVGLDARDGKVATRGWLEESELEASAVAAGFADCPLAAIIRHRHRWHVARPEPRVSAHDGRLLLGAADRLGRHRLSGRPAGAAAVAIPGSGRGDRWPRSLRRAG
jgi:phosphoribosylformimino-5-aminoimidazole carboxamide ribotide isomerase